MNTRSGEGVDGAQVQHVQGVTPVSHERAHDAHAADGAQSEHSGQMRLPLGTGTDTMRAAEANEVSVTNPSDSVEAPDVVEASDVADTPVEATVMNLHERVVDPLGQRLCAARERLGWSRADVAARLKLPLQLIGRIESDDYTGVSQGVFLRGYLASYSRLVGIPPEEAQHVAAAHTQAVPLIATGTISRSRYLFDRYSVSATYLILTAIIVVPAVWLATHGGLEQNLARTTPLDPPAATTTALAVPDQALATTTDVAQNPTATADSQAATPGPAEAPPATSAAVDQAPVTASMTPFSTTPTPAPAEPAATTTAATAATGGAHALELKLSQQSWVEILTADGRKLEYGMLSAGSEHSYRSDGPVSMRIGNAQGAVVHSDGQVIDLAPFQRGNVAHVRLFGGAGNGATRIDQ